MNYVYRVSNSIRSDPSILYVPDFKWKNSVVRGYDPEDIKILPVRLYQGDEVFWLHDNGKMYRINLSTVDSGKAQWTFVNGILTAHGQQVTLSPVSDLEILFLYPWAHHLVLSTVKAY